jgi:glycosyltransferase involved in cell wall biosynthesis
MDPLRIAVLLPHLGVYGGIRRFLELGAVWTRRGHDVLIATPRTAAARDAWLPFAGRTGDVERVPEERWDVLLSPDPDLFVRVATPGALRVFYAVLEKAPGARHAWSAADLVFGNSAGMVRHLRRRGVRALAAPGGVNLARFHPPADDGRSARARIGGPVRALVYGRLSRRRKGSLTAARAVDVASRASGVPVELTLFDTPPPGSRGTAEGVDLGIRIPHRWALRPTQEELAALYGDADVFVSAERRAGWCNTAAEAMACGAAVVCTRSGTEDFARDGATAHVSRWPWAWSLARRLAPLLRDPALRARVAEAGRRKIGEFTWERTADLLEQGIRRQLEGRDHAAKAS